MVPFHRYPGKGQIGTLIASLLTVVIMSGSTLGAAPPQHSDMALNQESSETSLNPAVQRLLNMKRPAPLIARQRDATFQANDPRWHPHDSPTSAIVQDLEMLSEDEGWAVGWTQDDVSEVLHFSDGHWRVVMRYENRFLFDVDVVGDGEFWLAGFALQDGFRPILTWVSDGEFTEQAVPECQTLIGLQMLGPDEGWAVGNAADSSSCILRLVSGQWIRDDSPGDALLVAIDLDSAGHGWALGSEGQILERSEGIWQTQESPAAGTGDALALYLDLRQDGRGGAWAVGWDSRFTLRFAEGAWHLEDMGFPGFLNGLDVLESGEVWAVGRKPVPDPPEPIMLKLDATGWRAEDLPELSGALGAIDMLDAGFGWAVGSGLALHFGEPESAPTATQATSATSEATGTPTPSASATPDPSFHVYLPRLFRAD